MAQPRVWWGEHCGPFLLGAALACGSDDASRTGNDPLDLTTLPVPPNFPRPLVPEENVPSLEKIELGRHLFYDERLSGNGTQSCGSCHRQDLAFSDGRPLPLGSTGETIPRNSPSLTNSAYNATLTWANPTLRDFETQFLVPLYGESPVELGATGNERAILERFRNSELYSSLFAAAFPETAEPVEFSFIVDALASFVRTLISGNSPYDEFTYNGRQDALSASARRGLELFFSERLECHHCHGGFNFSQSTVTATTAFDTASFQNTGLYNVDGQGAYPPSNTGLFDITGDPADMGRFRAPTLRNIEVTGPYMHDGSVESLDEVLRLYEAGGRNTTEGPNAGDGRASPLKSGFLVGFTLTDSQRSDVIEFLKSLTDTEFLENPRYANPFPEPSQ